MAEHPQGGAPATRTAALEALDERGRGLRLAFPWRRDRFAHTIAVADGRRLAPLLASHEGGQEDWPPSPPLQQLHFQPRPDGGRLALLVGQGAAGHWSMSVEAAAAAPRLICEIACRIQQPPGRLGSAYRSMLAPDSFTPHSAAVFPTNAGPCQIVILAAGDQPPAELQLTAAGLAVIPRRAMLHPPATIRWSYRIELC